jgi:hypothetical protein
MVASACSIPDRYAGTSRVIAKGGHLGLHPPTVAHQTSTDILWGTLSRDPCGTMCMRGRVTGTLVNLAEGIDKDA